MLPRAFICLLLFLGLPVFSFAAHTREVYKTVGDVKLLVDIDTPEDWKASDKRPAIVFFFGGGWNTGSTGALRGQAEYFAKRGMVCLRADYRVSSRHDVTPDKCVEDAISAMRWTRANAARLGIDPNRIVAAGGSAGGHIAACTFFTDTISAKTDDKAVSPKPNAMILNFAVLDLYVRYRVPGVEVWPGMSASMAKRISPLQLMRKGIPPTLLVCGTNDSNYKLNKQFLEHGRKLGAQVEGYWAEGQPHAFFGRPGQFEKVMARTDAFLVGIGFLAPMPEDAPVVPTRGKKGAKKGAAAGQP